MRHLIEAESEIVAVLIVPALVMYTEYTHLNAKESFVENPTCDVTVGQPVRTLDPSAHGFHGCHPFGAFQPATKACLAHSGQGFADR